MNHKDMALGTCMVCHTSAKLSHVNLYVNGSEGLNTCKPCELEIVDHVREKMREHSFKRKEEFKRKKRERKVICLAAKYGECQLVPASSKCIHRVEHHIRADCHGSYCNVKEYAGPCENNDESDLL